MGLPVAVCVCARPPPRPWRSHRAARGHPTWRPVAGLRRTSPGRPRGLRQGQIAVSPKLLHGQAWGSGGDALRALLAVQLPRERRPSCCPAPNCQDRKLLPAARLRGALVPLLTCPRRCLAGLSLPLWGLLWEFPALLLSRRLFKGSMNNLALTKSGLKQVTTGPYTFTASFWFLQAQAIKKRILNEDISSMASFYFFLFFLPTLLSIFNLPKRNNLFRL